MRLIDVDETLRLMAFEEYQYQFEENYGYRQAEKFISEQPTVEAIPIEWIEKKLNCCDNINAEIFVKALIRDWRKENGRSE